jgi:hypothetical protein
VKVCVAVGVLVSDGVKVGVGVKVNVGVLLGVFVNVLVLVEVKVRVAVGVLVSEGVKVGVGVKVNVAVLVGVNVRVAVFVCVGDIVLVGVFVFDGVTEGGIIVKLAALVAVPPGLVMLIGPVVAPVGTLALSEVALRIVKLASVPLNFTALTRAKLTPLMITLVPTSPLVGEKPVMVSGTALTAAAASSIPLPQRDVVQVLPLGNALEVLCRICSTWVGVRNGLSENISETTPVTWGADMLVPW